MNQSDFRRKLIHKLNNYGSEHFENIAIEIFDYQRHHNILYRNYLEQLGKLQILPNCIEEIPFLPIEFFKSHVIKTGNWNHQTYFSSSGTTGSKTSNHYIRDLEAYSKNTKIGFEKYYGPIEDYLVVALLPSYLERTGSSLVYMVNDFIKRSKFDKSGFFLYEFDQIHRIISNHLDYDKGKILFIGVSFALLDFIEKFPAEYGDQLVVMETGGMKGRRKELIRSDLHEQLQKGLGVSAIHSEYGMTELLSQAYSKEKGLFYCTDFMRANIRDLTDPFSYVSTGTTGGLNVVDLKNLDTISFIATEDLGVLREDGSFEVKGRIDFSDIRGCNLMI